ncbi:hypothetical protein [Rathayibacter sp. Leaf299]|uniref:hypothetical protein n=1 Tax=Rathayibacter sp. Leaf299 TaxID=1736328 RepID=UPI0012F8A6E5|nr:hypothetical protein [Rathayibacter sp. Leaf299]
MITSRFGDPGWQSVAIGTSIGSAAAVLVELGWGLNGPQRVARASLRNRRQTLALSSSTKALVYAPLAVAAGSIAFLLADSFRVEGALVAAGTAGAGLSLSWFFVGTREPGRLVVTDAIPRVIAVVVASLLMLSGLGLWVYGAVALILPGVAAPLLGLQRTGVRFADFQRLSVGRLARTVRSQLAALSGRALSAVYIALPVALVSIVAPGAVSVFAAAERLQRMYLTVLIAVPNLMQSWVGGASTADERLARARRGILLNAGFGLVAGGIFTAIAPFASSLIFSGVATIPWQVAALCGAMIFVVCTSRATGNLALVALRRIDVIAYSALAGTIVGVPSILGFSSLLGPAGAVLGELLAEATVLAVQLSGVARGHRRRS